MKNVLKKLYLALLLIFMYAPIITLIVLSFNSSKSRAKWGGFTLNWYINLLSDEAVAGALINTLTIAILATIFSTIIGTVTSIAMIGLNTKLRSFIMGITNIPMIDAPFSISSYRNRLHYYSFGTYYLQHSIRNAKYHAKNKEHELLRL